jgi:hypothetical protein
MNKQTALTQSKTWIGVVLVAILLFLAAAPPAAAAPSAAPQLQTPERITFAPGMMSAVRYGHVDLANPKEYVIHALAGQQMLVSIYSGGDEANFAITGVDDGQPYKRVVNESRTFAFTLPTTQDYLITVQSVTPVDYTLAVIIPPLVTPPPPPPPIRIHFASGAISATVEGTINPPARDEYVIKALAGQQMTVQIASAGDEANFAITGVSDGQPYKRLVNEDRSFTFTLPQTQDYRITVASVTPVDYALTVTIPPLATPTPAPHPRRIRFARGAISATVHGTINPPARDEYVLKALAGQQMTVQVASAGAAANFAITGVSDGQPYKRLVNEDRTFTFTLPRTQDYLITVASVTPANYALTVTIP